MNEEPRENIGKDWPVYDRDRKCPKCGAGTEMREWRDGAFVVVSARKIDFMQSSKKAHFPTYDFPESLQVTCLVCHAAWHELPLDAKVDGTPGTIPFHEYESFSVLVAQALDDLTQGKNRQEIYKSSASFTAVIEALNWGNWKYGIPLAMCLFKDELLDEGHGTGEEKAE